LDSIKSDMLSPAEDQETYIEAKKSARRYLTANMRVLVEIFSKVPRDGAEFTEIATILNQWWIIDMWKVTRKVESYDIPFMCVSQ
jgi:hypothetical protein